MKIPFISRLFERRSTYHSWYSGDNILDKNSASGIIVSHESAMTITTVMACVRILSESVASLPLIVYRRRSDGGRDRDDNHPLSEVLSTRPNYWQTAFEFKEMLEAHLALRGNAYAEITYPKGRLELIPRHPDRVIPEMTDSGTLQYKVRDARGRERILPQGKVFHLRNYSDDGVIGLSPIKLAADAIGLAKAQETFSGKFFRNGATPSLIFRHPKFSQEKGQSFRQNMKDLIAGIEKSHNILTVSNDVEIETVGLSNEDSQLLESRKFSVEEISRIYRIPLHLLQNLDKSSFNNITHQSLEFVQYCLLAWLRRWESAISRDLLSDEDRRTHYAEFLIEGFLRGDSKTRSEFYGSAIDHGWLSKNEVREKENMNSIGPEGDVYITSPKNMNTNQESNQTAQDDEEYQQWLADKQRSAFSLLLSNALIRADRKASNALKRIEERGLEVDQKKAKFLSDHEKFIRSIIEPVFQSCAIASGGDELKSVPYAEFFAHRFVTMERDEETLEEISLREIERFMNHLKAKTALAA